MESAAFNSDQTFFTANIPASETDRGQFGTPGRPILIGIGEFLRRKKHREAEGPGAESRMSPPRPLAAFKLLSAAASRFISHSALSVGESLCRVADMTETAVAETAPSAVPAAKTKAPKKKATGQPKKAGPQLSEQIDQIVAACRERHGVSYQAILKGLGDRGVNVEKDRWRIKMNIKKKLENGSLVCIKGAGCNGSFKTARKEGAVKPVKKAKKTAVKAAKPRKPVPKKSIKSPATKQSVARKVGSKKSPPKKAAAKKTAAKKAVVKKPTAKKAAPKKPKAAVVKKGVKKSVKAKAPKPKKTAAKKK